jgi:hypothetical protein
MIKCDILIIPAMVFFFVVSFKHWEMGTWFGDLNGYVLSDIDKGVGKD